jgi:hypothetical protein
MEKQNHFPKRKTTIKINKRQNTVPFGFVTFCCLLKPLSLMVTFLGEKEKLASVKDYYHTETYS